MFTFFALVNSTKEGYICKPYFFFLVFFVTFEEYLEELGQHFILEKWGTTSMLSCMGRMAKDTTTLPWWWLK